MGETRSAVLTWTHTLILSARDSERHFGMMIAYDIPSPILAGGLLVFLACTTSWMLTDTVVFSSSLSLVSGGTVHVRASQCLFNPFTAPAGKISGQKRAHASV